MSPTSRVTHLLGMGVYAVVYGIARTAVVLGVAMLAFDLDLSKANYWAALVVLAVCSISLVGFGVVAAVMPLLSPEKGQQVTYIVSALLLLVSGVYYPVKVLPDWMQVIAQYSPVTYALEGSRAALQDGVGSRNCGVASGRYSSWAWSSCRWDSSSSTSARATPSGPES